MVFDRVSDVKLFLPFASFATASSDEAKLSRLSNFFDRSRMLYTELETRVDRSGCVLADIRGASMHFPHKTKKSLRAARHASGSANEMNQLHTLMFLCNMKVLLAYSGTLVLGPPNRIAAG